MTWIGDESNSALDRLPDHIKRNLEKTYHPFGYKAANFNWEQTIYTPAGAGTAVTASAETILVPDFAIDGGALNVGDILKYTLAGQQSTAITTPGTITFRLRWGGVGGVSVAASGAFAPDPTAAATNLTWMIEWWMQLRAPGSTGTSFGWGRVEWSDYDDASATSVVGNLNMRMAPPSGPTTATIDTTIDKLISPTYQSSVTTASCTALAAFLESVR